MPNRRVRCGVVVGPALKELVPKKGLEPPDRPASEPGAQGNFGAARPRDCAGTRDRVPLLVGSTGALRRFRTRFRFSGRSLRVAKSVPGASEIEPSP